MASSSGCGAKAGESGILPDLHSFHFHTIEPVSPLKVFPSFFASRDNAFRRLPGLSLGIALGVLATGLAITAASVLWLRSDLHAKAYGRFERQAEAINDSIKSQLKLPFLVLQGASGIYAASYSVEQAEFRAYMESSQVALAYPSLQGVGFAERVERSGLAAHVARQRRAGRTDFAVPTQGDLPDLFVVKFVEPLEANKSLVGLDLGAEPLRREAIERAINTAQATLSGLVPLTGAGDPRAALLFTVPVYRNGTHPVTPAQRQAALSGVLVTSVGVNEILADTLGAAQGQAAFRLYGRTAAPAGPGQADAAPGPLLFDSSAPSAFGPAAAQRLPGGLPLFEMSHVLQVGGRALEVRTSTTEKFEIAAQTRAPDWLGLAGGLLSAGLAWIVWLLATGRANALTQAGRMTVDLANERQQLANIVEGTNVATWVWHVPSGVIRLDERWAAMLGYDFAQLGVQSMSDWRNRIHPDERQAVQAAQMRHFRGETRFFEHEYRARHRDGHWVWVLDRGKVSSRTPEGWPEVMSGTQMDITDRQAIQMALRTSEKNFRQLFDSSLHGILQALPDGSVQYANPAACRLFGLSQDEIRLRGRDGLVALDDSRFHILIAQALLLGHARGGLTMKRGNGSRFECELSLTTYQNPSGQACNNLFLRDVTKRKQAEAQINALNAALEDKVRKRTVQLQTANQELEAFSYSVAHDLRAPLRSIDGFSHLLEKVVAADTAERSRHYLQRIRASVKQMGELTDGLLALAQVSRTPLKTETVNLSILAERALDACREHDTGRRVNTEVEPGLLASGDPALLYQVMENLLGNAWKFTAKTPEARIQVGRLASPGDGVQERNSDTENCGLASGITYFVRDNGAGFDMAYVEKLFGTFQRLHSPGEFAGTGIGLATTHRIVSRHTGRIWAEGVVGRGATFFFTLPCALETAEPREPADPAAAA